MNLQTVQQKFSKAAEHYDRHAIIQRYFGDMLLEELRNDRVFAQNILDVGTGTGNLLQNLKSIYGNANILGLDIAWGMLSKARERAPKLLQADVARLPFKDNSFNLVVSNLALQWVVDLDNVFSELSRVIKKEGKLYFTTFGPQTLDELRVIFPAIGERLKLCDSLVMENLLRNTGFQDIELERIIEKRIYPSMIDIIKWLKNIGANYTGYIPAKNLGMRKIWQEAEASYRSKFSSDHGVYATFETFLIKAKKD